MKKKIMITLLAIISISIAVYSLTEMEDNNPPNPTWGYSITWDDSNCNCGTIEASLDWEVTHLVNGNWVYVDGNNNLNIDYTLDEYIVTSSESLVDCRKCYKIYGRVTYEDSEGKCCSGWNYKIVDSYSLLYDDEVVHITMN